MVVGGFSFYQRAEVKDALLYLKLLISPQDNVSLLRVINTPARGIGKTTVEQLEKLAAGQRDELVGGDGSGHAKQDLLGPRAGAALARVCAG